MEFTPAETDRSSSSSSGTEHPSQSEIQAWLLSYLSELLEIDPNAIETNDSLASYGLDSTGAVGLVGDLAEWLDLQLGAELLYSYPTIESLTGYLVAKRGR